MGKTDFVILWVDGADEAWRAEKARYLPEYADCAHNGKTRYRDMKLLRYWFRGVEKNAPWVNKIHFVTWGHLPDWLDTAHPKLHIVRHEDYIPAEYLPTFNSIPIEINLHRISSLAECFVFFNDDTFLIRPVEETDFFYRGLPCDEIKRSEHLFSTGQNSFFAHIPFNDMCVINRCFSADSKRYFKGHWLSARYPARVNFDNFIDATRIGRGKYYQRFHDFHIPIPVLKSTMCEVWEKENALLSETSAHKARSPLDVNIWLFRYYQLAKGNFVPKDISKFGRCFTLGRGNDAIYSALKNRTYQTMCINDAASSEKAFDFDQTMAELGEIFQMLFPEKSAFEK